MASEPAAAPEPVWSFDAAAGALRIRGQDFRLTVKKEDLVPYSENILTWARTTTSLAATIEAFERGQWLNYTNAAERIRVLHYEKHKASLQLQSLAAEFQAFFEPAGIYEALGRDNAELNRIIRAIMDEVRK
jgi:hypothetical protein